MGRVRILCQCGGELGRPIPPACPHCGAVITQIRQGRRSQVLAILIVAGMFGALAWFTWWMVSG